MTQDEIIFEAVKLIAQGIVAFVVAWQSVRWALSRYQSEKIWEKRLSAYADLVAAVSEMKEFNAFEQFYYFDDLIQRSEEVVDERKKAYALARKKVEEFLALGQLLLPESTQKILQEFQRDLANNGPHASYEDELEAEGPILTEALEALIAEGKRVLKIQD
ncbi:hypothetical protein [uncultured Novosphingobium sp.]|uniref:hypothetical protein n=1 Tax=uncultured Novosphingobium sp. TaxID=292277 RepID=UPI002595DC71|nr:hypothetical protein [uncultured Novosphingobium sp.]